MTAEEILKNHIQLCDETYTLLVEENRHLRSHKTPTPDEILDKKRELLPKLDTSLDNIKKLGNIVDSKGKKLPKSLRSIAEEAQNKLMKIFYLDRENETLILKTSIPQKAVTLTNRPANQSALDSMKRSGIEINTNRII